MKSREAFVIAESRIPLDEGKAGIKVEVFVLLPDALADILREGVHEHLSQVRFAHPMTMDVALADPFANMSADVAGVFAWRKHVKVSQSMDLALLRAPSFSL